MESYFLRGCRTRIAALLKIYYSIEFLMTAASVLCNACDRFLLFRRSRPQVLCIKGVHKNVSKFKRKHLHRSLRTASSFHYRSSPLQMLRKKITLKSSREKLPKPSIKLATVRKLNIFSIFSKKFFKNSQNRFLSKYL